MTDEERIHLKVFNGIITHLKTASENDPRKRERLRALTGLRTIQYWIQKETDDLKERSKG